MVMNRTLMIRRKGFNYYTDYTELYLNRAFQNYGYSVVRDKSKSDFSVTVYISESAKYMIMISTFFNELSEGNVANLCEVFSDAFKSEAKIADIIECENASYEMYEFMLSKTYSAYDEPVYLVDETQKLEWRTRDVNFKTNKDFCMSFVNVGGKISGINITLHFNEDICDLHLSDAYISSFNGQCFPRREILFKKQNTSFEADVHFLNIEKGINPKSAVLRGKKRATEERRYGFWLGFLPVSKEDVVLKGTLIITSSGVEILKCDI